jgi:hypothetical protein
VKFYIAAATSVRPLMREWADDLMDRDHTVTSRWLSRKAEHYDAVGDIDDIRHSDVVIDNSFFNEGWGIRGVAIGLALAWDKRLVVVGPAEHEYHRLPEVLRYPDWDAFLGNSEWTWAGA